MTAKEVTKLKAGDKVRTKYGNWLVVVSGREDSGRVVYVKLGDNGPIASYKNAEVKKVE